MLLLFIECIDTCTVLTLYEHFNRAVGQLEHLQDSRDGTAVKQIRHAWLVFRCTALSDKQNLLIS